MNQATIDRQKAEAVLQQRKTHSKQQYIAAFQQVAFQAMLRGAAARATRKRAAP